ncbi:MAG TPA: penicillin acylase family protein [Candidatus Acidoferrales bacterium]|nr:penicillin acylase family protein [Candidatus Acidoferrales bacterium]
MRKLFFVGLIAGLAGAILPSAIGSQNSTEKGDSARWEKSAQSVTIYRDNWGIAHVYADTDANAVFGMVYAQCEDDFNRVETNYINAMGRLAETEGESKIAQDLRMKLFVDPADLKKQYDESPAWLKTLMNSWADALNFYLSKHPNVKPRVIQHFEPWMALSFTEGSIGGDIEAVNLNALAQFYGIAAPGPRGAVASNRRATSQDEDAAGDEAEFAEPQGSNGMAVAPANTVSHHSLLLINPHTSFFFRSELQMVSNEGLDAYGAATWGQFFVYQGFNDRAGWMHTTSGVNATTEYAETVDKKGEHYVYKYGSEERPVTETALTIPYKTASGMSAKKITVYRTQHGPIIREANGKWISYRIMREPIKSLEQSFLRTKAKDYKSYRATMDLQANSSNNTIFADGDGDIAYFHGNFIPRRDTSFDWTKPVDGSNPAMEWKGLLSVDETPHLLNPASGWIYNSNDWPWAVAGPSSPKKDDFPPYVEKGGPSARGQHAVLVLQNKKDFTLDGLIGAAFDSYQTWFTKPIPALVKAWDDAAADNPLKAKLAEPIAMLRNWDLRWSASSVPTSLAIFWGEDIERKVNADARRASMQADDYIATKVPGEQLLESLDAACNRLGNDFGAWKTAWGDVNRFQRLNDDIAPTFTDTGASIPVEFSSARWGSLASFGSRPYPGTKKWYGTSGNSFVAVVEFGDKVHAKAVTAGGESGNTASPHFDDEAQRYANGNLREVYFYREQLKGHTEREYHPGN